MRFLPIVLLIGFNLYALFDCARTPQEQVRRQPKWAWMLIIILFETFGSLLYIFLGRPKNQGSGPKRGQRRPIAPDDDPDFLRNL